MGLPNIKLWSNLKIRPTTRTEIQCPKGLQVSVEEFFAELTQKLSDNELPAMAELCEIQWDDSDSVQKRIMIKYTDTNVASNIIRILIGLDSIGDFTYIEEKVIILPPLKIIH
jgi:hypothetical protein